MKEEEITQIEASFLGGTRWRGADAPAPLRTLTSPLSLFSKDMWAATLRLGPCSNSPCLGMEVGAPFYSASRVVLEQVLVFYAGTTIS